MKTSPQRSYSVIEKERFGLVFAKTGSIISGTALIVSDLQDTNKNYFFFSQIFSFFKDQGFSSFFCLLNVDGKIRICTNKLRIRIKKAQKHTGPKLRIRLRFRDTAKNSMFCKKTKSPINALLSMESELTFVQFNSTVYR